MNWNGAFFVRHFLPLALELTDPRHRFSIWDNASKDGSWPLLAGLERQHPKRLRVFRSLKNKRHGTGLRKLLQRSDRELVVVLDCDAVPLREGWVSELSDPVLSGGSAAHGIPHSEERFVHPSCLCTTRSVLRELDVDVRPDYPRYDVLQRLTVSALADGRSVSFIEADGDLLFDGFGLTYGDGLVYHHWFGTRVNPIAGMKETPEGRTTDGLARSQAALKEWLGERGQLRTCEASGLTPLRTLRALARAHGPGRLSR